MGVDGFLVLMDWTWGIKMTEKKRFASVHDFVIGECEMFEGTFCDKEKPNGKCLRCDEE